MLRWTGLLLAAVSSVGLAACSSVELPHHVEPPDLIAQVANADLGAAAPRAIPSSAGQSIAGDLAQKDAETRSKTYFGSDQVARPLTNSGITQGGNGYELNFNEADLSELVRVVLKETLAIPYSFDQRVQGRVTLSTGGPVPKADLLKVLESALATNHAVLLPDGHGYRIVPESEGKQEFLASFDYAKERLEIGSGYGVAIVPLQYVATDTMLRILEPLTSKDQSLRTSVSNNLLFIRGTAQERSSALDLVSMFDVNWMKGQSAGIFVLRQASPDDVIKELEQVFRTNAQGKDLVRFQTIARLNAVLVVAQKSYLLKEADTWISRLDQGGEGDSYYVYRVENGRAKDLAALLMQAFANKATSASVSEEAEVAPTRAVSKVASTASKEAKDTVINDSSGSLNAQPQSDPGTPEPNFHSSPSSEVRITPDERNNKLLIRASARDLRSLLSILRRVDQQPQQVLINATLAEVTLNDNLQYGVQFFFQKNGLKQGVLGFTNGAQLDITPAVPGLNFIIGNIASHPQVIIDALAKETTVRVVSSPSVVVVHNQTATLKVGDEIPYTTRQAQSVQNPDSPLVTEVQYKNTGVILKVTPRINSNGLVTMEIDQEISSVARSTSSAGTLTPTISERSIRSVIAVQSGQMVVLGGLISEQVDREKSRIPVLGKIPYIGDIVGGNTDNTKQRTELVVFLRPSVIRDAQDAANVAEAVRAGMQSLAPRPAAWDPPQQTKGYNPIK